MTIDHALIRLCDVLRHHDLSANEITLLTASADRTCNELGKGALINAVQSAAEIQDIHERKRVVFRDDTPKNYTDENNCQHCKHWDGGSEEDREFAATLGKDAQLLCLAVRVCKHHKKVTAPYYRCKQFDGDY